MVAILSWIYETNSINQLQTEAEGTTVALGIATSLHALSTLFAQAKARLLQWHNKHKASCSQPPSVVKTVVKPELESTTRLRWIKLCISLSSSVHEVSHYVSQGHWCWIILVHVVHQDPSPTNHTNIPHLKRIASPRSNLPFNLCILRPSNSRFTTMAGRSK